ncbi:MAG: RNA polymerase sigma factor [Cellulosilyticaceae bacterium]
MCTHTVSFEDLLVEHKLFIERFIYYKIASIPDAEDVIQNTYLSAYKNFHNLKDLETFKYWLLKIAKNECNLFYRKHSTNPTISFDEYPIDTLTTSPIHLSTTTSERVNEIISEMPVQAAHILCLFFLQGKKQQEIADILNLPLGTVKSRIHYAKSQFRAHCPLEVKSYYIKGESAMKKTLNFPLLMPSLTLTKTNKPFFEVKCEEECFVIPRVGNHGAHGDYAYPDLNLTTVSTCHVLKKAFIHDVEGVKVCRDTYNVQSDRLIKNEAIWFTQLTETHIRSLANLQYDDDETFPTKLFTFFDEEFNTACNYNSIHGIPLIIKENPVTINNDEITISDYTMHYTEGVYNLTINSRHFECIKYISVQENTIMTEHFVDRNGREVLLRWYEPFYWLDDEVKEKVQHNTMYTLNGQNFVHLEDRLSVYAL